MQVENKTRNKNLQKFHTYILTLDANLRNNDLLSFFKLNSLSCEVVIGIDGRNKPKWFFQDSRHDFLSRINIGRRLTNEEIACGLGHLKIYSLARKSGLSWFLVCEDDSFPRVGLQVDEIHKLIEDFEVINEKTNHVEPSIIHLGPCLKGEIDEMYGECQFGSMTPILNSPYGAFAYLINLEAINLICLNPMSKHFISPCDWPTHWSKQIKFFRTHTPLFLTGTFNSSYIEPSRLASKSKNSILDRVALRVRLISKRTGITEMILRVNGFS